MRDYKKRKMTLELATNASSKKLVAKRNLKVEDLKEKVMKMLVETPDNSAQKLVLIYTMQRLGVSYHFDNEIEKSIQNIFDTTMSQLQSENDDNLYVVSLRFQTCEATRPLHVFR
ncbi:hypothetical protein R3W88_017017 [Solanum pinnatisectum]|uniref:Terpene synthase N-terminal domain-containing protein n=1 Tax=Solanum pinnatisectum TaxID=50273 RepID=A0AAV9KZF8_9SOLN|nr:hypothetical protein R3W88_017017 [Solanum pinnatisectum]